MPDTFNMSDVFISYAREDKTFAQQLDAALRGKGRQCWVDWEDIPLSADWLQEVKAGIESADTFIFVISPDSLRSVPCSQEVMHAVEHGKRIVPILRRSPEDSDMERMHPKLSAHNWVFFDKDDAFEKSFTDLNSALDTDMEHVRQQTRLLVRAREWANAGNNPSLLLRGDDLHTAEDWVILADLEKKEPAPIELQRQYIVASRKAANVARRTTIAATLIILGFATLTLIALIGFTRAEEQRQIAESAQQIAVAERDQSVENAARARSLSLASSSLVAFTEGNNDLALTLAMLASEGVYVPQTELALAKVAYAPGARIILSINDDRFESIPGALAINPDGTQFASGHNDGSIIIWDLLTGEKLVEIEDDEQLIQTLVYSPDGATLFSTGADGLVHRWDVTSGAEIQRYADYGDVLYGLTISPDGRTMVAGGNGGDLIVWDVESGAVLKRWTAHDRWVDFVVYNPDGAQLASSGGDNTIILWDTTDWSQTAVLEGHFNIIRSMSYNSDGTRLISGSQDFTIRQWDPATGQLIRVFGENVIGHTDWVTSVAYEPGGTRVISGAEDNSMLLWNGETGELIKRFTDHHAQIYAVAFSPDKRTAISASEDGSINIWDLASGAEIAQTPFKPSINDVISTAFLENGTQFMVTQDDGTISWWNAADQTPVETITVGDEAVISFLIAPNEQIAASVIEADDAIVIWDFETAEVLHRFTLDEGEFFHPTALAFNADSTQLLAGTDLGNIYLIDAASGEALKQWASSNDIVNSLAFSLDGKKVLSADADWKVNQWDIESGQLLTEFDGHTDSIQSAVYNSDETQILSASWDNTIVLSDAVTGKPLRLYEGHTGAVLQARFLANDTKIISTSSDGTIRIWDAETGVELRRYEVNATVNGLAINPDETIALTTSTDGTVRLWHIHNFDELLEWTLANRHPLDLTCPERLIYDVHPFCDEATVLVAVDVANVYAEANINAALISEVRRDERYPIIGETTVGESGWYQIEMPSGRQGWVKENEVSVQQPE